MSSSWSSLRGPRGGPGDFQRRIERSGDLLADDPSALGAAREPLVVLDAVLRHQQARADVVTASPPQPDPNRTPALDLDEAAPQIVDELAVAFDALGPLITEPLRDLAGQLDALSRTELAAIVETWLDDATLVEPAIGVWVGVAAGPVLELGARDAGAASSGPTSGSWRGSACPMCGGQPAASVIAEESGEFMAGSPRSLVCGRCATWWPYSRAVCAACGEDDSRNIEGFLVEDRRSVRVDTCSTCRAYIKTFDFREDGATGLVPLVDDVATLRLDVWAQQQGYTRPVTSLAGV